MLFPSFPLALNNGRFYFSVFKVIISMTMNQLMTLLLNHIWSKGVFNKSNSKNGLHKPQNFFLSYLLTKFQTKKVAIHLCFKRVNQPSLATGLTWWLLDVAWVREGAESGGSVRSLLSHGLNNCAASLPKREN